MISKKGIILLAFISLEIGALSFAAVSFSKNQKQNDNTSSITSGGGTPKYLVHTVSFETNGGSVISPITVRHGHTISKPRTPVKAGYAPTDWKHNSNYWDFDTDIVLEDIELEVDWNIITYTIEYNFDGGHSSEHFETSYTVESDFDIPRPIKNMSVFAGWFDQHGHRVDSITQGSTGDLILTARWLNNLVVKSLDETRGTVEAYGDETNPYKVTLKNIPVNYKNHVFKGWYNTSGALLSQDDRYTFVLDPNTVSYIDAKYMTDEEENDWNTEHCFVPKVDGDYVYYGLYPQNVVTNASLISKLNDTDTSYFNNYHHYRGEYYLKEKAELGKDMDGKVLSIREFDCGEEIVADQYYWFKLEPIKWKVISNSSSSKFLLSERLLSVEKYYRDSSSRDIDEKIIYPNNYKYSDVRNWLNEDFYQTAFAFGDDNLLTSSVDNSASTIENPEYPQYCCENTNDKVFLLSYQDYRNEDYGFSSESSASLTRTIKTTDFTRALGATYGTDSYNLFCGYYWTRSPYSGEYQKDGTLASRVNKNGTLNEDFVGQSRSCVQPAIKIEI